MERVKSKGKKNNKNNDNNNAENLNFLTNCHNPNSTSTQLKSWVWHENDFNPPPPPTTTTHHHPHKLNVSNISAVTDPISTKL